MTTSELSELVGVSRQYVYVLLSGEQIPSLDIALRFGRALGRPVGELWELTEVGIRASKAHNRRR